MFKRRKLYSFVTVIFLLAACQTSQFDGADPRHALYKPSGKGPFPAVIVMHAGGGTGPGDHNYARSLAAQGYVAMVVDTYGTRGIRSTWQIGFKRAAFFQLSDAYGAFSYLATLPDVDEQRIGILGFSRGGHTVLNALTPEESMPSYLKAMLKRPGRFRAGVAYYPDCLEYGAVFEAPLLILIGNRDREVNVALCERIVENARAKGADATIKVYPGARHVFDVGKRRDPDAAWDAKIRVRDFLLKHL